MTDVQVLILDRIPQRNQEEIWDLLEKKFEKLNLNSPIRQGITLEEYLQIAEDPDHAKFIVINDSGICGIGIASNNFEKLPWVSAPFYRRKYGEDFDEGRVWCVGILAAQGDDENPLVVFPLVKAMFREGSRRGAKFIAYDYSNSNGQERRSLTKLLTRIGSDFVEDEVDDLGYQHYVAFRFRS